MTLGRTILVFLVALSVAMLPVAGGVARAMSLGTTLTAVQADCCPHGRPCEKKTPDDCGSVAGCALKCFNAFGATIPIVVGKAFPVASLAPSFISLSLPPSPSAPPLPPPRV